MSLSNPPSAPLINRNAFLIALLPPVIVWVTIVAILALAGQPGVVCVTPAAWMLALWSGLRYVQASNGVPGRRPMLAAALLGAVLGLVQGIIFTLVTSIDMGPSTAYDLAKAQSLDLMVGGGGIVVCALLSMFTAWITLKRYAREQRV